MMRHSGMRGVVTQIRRRCNMGKAEEIAVMLYGGGE